MTIEELQNGAGTAFLFHYTDAIRADAIIEERLFISGPRVARGFGIYATEIARGRRIGVRRYVDGAVHARDPVARGRAYLAG